MTWTDQKIQMLREMWGHGYSASDIAKRLGGLTRNAVIGKAHRMKLSGRPSPIHREDEGRAGTTALARVARPAKKSVLRVMPALPQPPVQAGYVPVVKRTTESLKSAVPPLKTTDRQCRWPHGDPRSRDFKFCGCAAIEGLPYCPEHARLAYQNFGRSRKREDDNAGSETAHSSAAAV